jgi:hypothetical protein
MTSSITIYIEASEVSEADNLTSVELFELRVDRDALTRIRDAHKATQQLNAAIDLLGLVKAVNSEGEMGAPLTVYKDGTISSRTFVRVPKMWPICNEPIIDIALTDIESWLRDHPTGTEIFVGMERTVALLADPNRKGRDVANDIFFGETSGIDEELIILSE